MEQIAQLSLISNPGTGVLDSPSWIRRAMLIEQVAEGYADGLFTPAQRRVAEDLFRTAVYDAEALVRSVLADSLKRIGGVPRDIVLMLARDEAQVARPVLSCSPLLSEDDLLEIARTGSRPHRLAIAERDNLSPALSEALYESRDAIVVRRLLANDGAALAEGLQHAILDTLGNAPGIVETMARRRLLPVSVLERLQHYRIAERPRAQAPAALRA